MTNLGLGDNSMVPGLNNDFWEIRCVGYRFLVSVSFENGGKIFGPISCVGTQCLASSNWLQFIVRGVFIIMSPSGFLSIGWSNYLGYRKNPCNPYNPSFRQSGSCFYVEAAEMLVSCLERKIVNCCFFICPPKYK